MLCKCNCAPFYCAFECSSSSSLFSPSSSLFSPSSFCCNLQSGWRFVCDNKHNIHTYFGGGGLLLFAVVCCCLLLFAVACWCNLQHPIDEHEPVALAINHRPLNVTTALFNNGFVTLLQLYM